MARINVEDSLFKDNRFSKLIIKLGSKRVAIGAMVEAFFLAQECFKKDPSTRLIPLKKWRSQDMCDEIISVGLADVIGGNVYVCGSEKQFAWLEQRKAAGKKGGLAKASKPKPPSPSLSLSPSPAPSQTQSLPLSLNYVPEQPEVKTSVSTGAIPEFALDGVAYKMMATCSTKAQRAWLETYPNADWLIMETKKAYAWIQSNPNRAPKQMARFLANWFSRGYEAYRKGQPVNKTNSQRNADGLRDLHDRVKKGEI